MKRTIVLLSCLLSILVNKLNDTLDQSMLQSLLNIFSTPFINSLLLDNTSSASFGSLQLLSGPLSHGNQPLDMLTIFTLVPDDLFEDRS